MAGDKKPVDVGLIFGPPPKGAPGAMGPDSDFKVLAHQVLDPNAPMAARVDALHELIHTCIAEAEQSEDEEEAPEAEHSEGEHGGY